MGRSSLWLCVGIVVSALVAAGSLVGAIITTRPPWAIVTVLSGALAALFLTMLVRLRLRGLITVLDRRTSELSRRFDDGQSEVRGDIAREVADLRASQGDLLARFEARMRTRVLAAEEDANDRFERLQEDLEGVRRALGTVASAAREMDERVSSKVDLAIDELESAMAQLGVDTNAGIDKLQQRHQQLFDSVARFRETYKQARTDLKQGQRLIEADVLKLRRLVGRTQADVSALAIETIGEAATPTVLEGAESLALRVLRSRLQGTGTLPEDALVLLHRLPELANQLSVTELRKAARLSRQLGFSSLAISLLEKVFCLTEEEQDGAVLEAWRDERYVEEMDFDDLLPDGVEPLLDSVADVVIHVVGHSLPHTQSGYTIRTHETAKAQLAVGLTPHVVNQGGIYEDVQNYELDGVSYWALQTGPRKGRLRSDWLKANVEALVALARELKPAILHAHSDYLNAMIAECVGKVLGIPVVYEQRGFWEESWWSRVVDSHEDRRALFSKLPLPEAYASRQRQEAQARSKATRVVTLAEVMVEHAKDQNDRFGWGMPAVDVVQNAVDVDQFAQVRRRPELATELGIAGPVVGYVSSMVAYEGIDVLVDGFLQLRNLLRESKGQTDEQLAQTLVRDWAMGDSADALLQPVRQLASGPEPELLLVGDGIAVQRLDDGVRLDPGIHLVGRVPKDEVLEYYGLIDVFVVPRKPFAVSELVTPLKPFEAMAAGRALIMSDVRALREIAQESGASLLFEPGNATDLAAQLARLLADEDQRESLGRKGREWVSKARTWEENAWAYAALYSELGMQFTPSLWAVGRRHLKPLGLSATPLLRGLQEAETPRAGGWFDASEQTQSAAEIMEDGWLAPGVGRLEWQGFNWDEACKDHRSAAFHLHSWDLIQPAMREWFETRDEALLDWMLMVAQSWRAHVLAGPAEGSMAWYDMALAVRLGRLGRLVCWAVQCGREAQGLELVPLLLEHVDRLLEPGAFNPRNNHGFFAAAAGLDHHRLFGSVLDTGRVHAISDERMRTMVEAQFAPDGGHREHSPAYHGFLLGSFQAAVREGLIDDPALVEVLRRAEHALGWFVQPDGLLAQFGDTDAVAVNQAMLAEVTDEATLFQISRGEKGCSTTDELFVLPEAGYAMVRSPQPQNAQAMGTESYLAVLASFHSRAHKHADDLTVVWTHKGHEVLVDSGRFGYLELLPADSPDRLKGFYYSRPERQYVESTRAHNTVEVDGRDIERRKRSAYGSGILQASHLSDGSFWLDAEAPHDTYVHRRRLHFHPGHSLIFDDELILAAEHEVFTVWFNLNGDLEVKEARGHVDFSIPNTGEIVRMTSSVEAHDIVRGQTGPLRGWRSRRDRHMEPAWSVAIRVPVTSRHQTIRTQFHVIDPKLG